MASPKKANISTQTSLMRNVSTDVQTSDTTFVLPVPTPTPTTSEIGTISNAGESVAFITPSYTESEGSVRSFDSSLISENFAGSYSSSNSNVPPPNSAAELFQSISAAANGKSLEELANKIDQENDELLLQYYDAMLSMEEDALRNRLAYENNLLETSEQ